jgi:hypothetical protein
MLIPRQAGLAVKAWSPEKANVGEANGVNGPVGSSLLEVAKGCPLFPFLFLENRDMLSCQPMTYIFA